MKPTIQLPSGSLHQFVVKGIWVLTGLHTLALLVFVIAYFVLNKNKNVDYQEKGWTFILACLGGLLIVLTFILLRAGHSTTSLVVAACLGLLPVSIYIAGKLPSFRKSKSFTDIYYSDKIQRKIGNAIETNNISLLTELIRGQDINKRGNQVWEAGGLNYLQFAIRLRSNPINFPFNDAASQSTIRFLLARGVDPSPALAEACSYLPIEMISLLLDAGANPNSNGFSKPNSLVFYLIGADKAQNDIAILLLRRGADVNALNDEGNTALMYAARTAGHAAALSDCWRVVIFLLEEAHADYAYQNHYGRDLLGIISDIQSKAADSNSMLPENFYAVANWLQLHHAGSRL